MSRLVSIVGVVFALGIMAVSAAVNARYGMSLAREGFDQWVMVAVALFVDGGKALSWIFFASAIGRREWLAAAASGVIFVGCMFYAVSSSLGFVAMNRAQSTATVATGADTARALDEELKRKRDELNEIGSVQPAAVIAKAIEAKQVDRIFTATNKCTDVTAASSRVFCASLAMLEGEEKKAEAKAALEQDIAALQTKRNALGGVAVVEKGDFQGALIAQLTRLNVSEIQLSLALLFVIVVESGACFFLWLTLNYGAGLKASVAQAVAAPPVAKPVDAPPMPKAEVAVLAPVMAPIAVVEPAVAKPQIVAKAAPAPKAIADQRTKREGDLVEFVDRCIDFMPGGCTAIEDIEARYRDWCQTEGFDPVSEETLVEGIVEFCEAAKLDPVKIDGRYCLDGVVLIKERRKRARAAR